MRAVCTRLVSEDRCANNQPWDGALTMTQVPTVVVLVDDWRTRPCSFRSCSSSDLQQSQNCPLASCPQAPTLEALSAWGQDAAPGDASAWEATADGEPHSPCRATEAARGGSPPWLTAPTVPWKCHKIPPCLSTRCGAVQHQEPSSIDGGGGGSGVVVQPWLSPPPLPQPVQWVQQ